MLLSCEQDMVVGHVHGLDKEPYGLIFFAFDLSVVTDTHIIKIELLDDWEPSFQIRHID